MAKEFFELWRENSIVKKIVAALLIAGAVAASVDSIFNLKDIFIDKKDNTSNRRNNSYYNSGNGYNQQGGQGNTQGRDYTEGGKVNIINIQSKDGEE